MADRTRPRSVVARRLGHGMAALPCDVLRIEGWVRADFDSLAYDDGLMQHLRARQCDRALSTRSSLGINSKRFPENSELVPVSQNH